MSKIHNLKTWPQFYEQILAGLKTFEIRFNDRNFQVGDLLNLIEYDPKTEAETGRDSLWKVTYMTVWEQKPNFVVMAIEDYKGIHEEVEARAKLLLEIDQIAEQSGLDVSQCSCGQILVCIPDGLPMCKTCAEKNG